MSPEEKFLGKRFNKTLDRVVAVSIAFGLAVIAYGSVQEVLSRQATETGVRWTVFAGSLCFGIGTIVAAVVAGYILHQRED